MTQLVQSHPELGLSPGLVAIASVPATLLRGVLPQPHRCALGSC